MAAPRAFVSSTCYDLQEIRHGLRPFILEFGLEPVMSEFGDIFYEFDKHVQDACIEEIGRCHVFILIVGNRYGSSYHREAAGRERPDSVTLKEFRKALSTRMPKHIFVNRFLQHDYNNYRKELHRRLKERFSARDVPMEETGMVVDEIRQKLDAGYPFPELSYRYIFPFLDEINDLKVNNAILSFETLSDIKEQLRSQWAGIMYTQLTASQAVPMKVVEEFDARLARIEKLIGELVSGRSEDQGTISLDLAKLSESIVKGQLAEAQDLLAASLETIMFDGESLGGEGRGTLCGEVSADEIHGWLENLKELLGTYKWARTIPFGSIWPDEFAPMDNEHANSEIPQEALLKLNGLFRRLPDREVRSFAETILLKLRPILRQKASDMGLSDDDIPF